MPPRLAVVTIIIFWLAAIGWLIQREMWPQWFPPPDEPPDYDIDLMDEIGRNTTNWYVYLVLDGKEESVGEGISGVDVLKDGSLEFQSRLRFPKTPLVGMITFVESKHRITQKGHLINVALKIKFKLPYELDFKANIEDGLLRPNLSVIPADFPLPKLDPIPVPENGIVLNPAHMGTRMKRLRAGQTWRVPLLDPTPIVSKALVKSILPASFLSGFTEEMGTELWAEVKEETIRWAEEDVDCFRIDYAQLGNRASKMTQTSWVRRRDGQVLQQQGGIFGLRMKLVRVPNSGF